MIPPPAPIKSQQDRPKFIAHFNYFVDLHFAHLVKLMQTKCIDKHGCRFLEDSLEITQTQPNSDLYWFAAYLPVGKTEKEKTLEHIINVAIGGLTEVADALKKLKDA